MKLYSLLIVCFILANAVLGILIKPKDKSNTGSKNSESGSADKSYKKYRSNTDSQIDNTPSRELSFREEKGNVPKLLNNYIRDVNFYD